MDGIELYDIYGFIKIPFWQTYLFYIIIVCTGLALSIFLLYFCFVRMRKKRNRHIQKPWHYAYRIISEYEYHADKGSADRFYVMLSSTIKEYLAQRYEFPLQGKTDEELLACLNSLAIDSDVQEAICALIQSSIYVKFANYDAIEEKINQDKVRAITIIRNTIPEHEQI